MSVKYWVLFNLLKLYTTVKAFLTDLLPPHGTEQLHKQHLLPAPLTPHTRTDVACGAHILHLLGHGHQGDPHGPAALPMWQPPR
jgi:hypothetical protein